MEIYIHQRLNYSCLNDDDDDGYDHDDHDDHEHDDHDDYVDHDKDYVNKWLMSVHLYKYHIPCDFITGWIIFGVIV